MKSKLVYDVYDAPFGPVHIIMDETGVRRLTLIPEQWEQCRAELGDIQRDAAACSGVIAQLEEYFSGKRKEFSVPLSFEGTEFYQAVWRELLSIPYGETRSYAEIAAAVGKPKACRAVGQANRKNLLPILIPCHRVVGKKGEMTGYIGKHIDIKVSLLELERKA